MRSIMVLGVLAAVAAAGAGDDLARAQKKGDVVEVQRLLRSVLDRASLRKPESLHKLMMQLDPKRAGAFVSAPSIARGFLLGATATGNMKYVADAAKVIRTHARQRGAGKCAQVMVV